MIRTQGLTHIHLMVSDLERSLRFYQSVFGLEEQYRDGPAMVFLRTPGARDTITLNEVPDANNRGPGRIDHFGFRLVDKADIDRAIADVEAAGGRLIERSPPDADRTFAYVADPDGNIIEL